MMKHTHKPAERATDLSPAFAGSIVILIVTWDSALRFAPRFIPGSILSRASRAETCLITIVLNNLVIKVLNYVTFSVRSARENRHLIGDEAADRGWARPSLRP
jgi:hypothetical protein